MTSPSSRSWIKPAIAAALLLAVGGIAYATFANKVAAPQVSYTTITGEKLSTDSLRGKVVMVNFWATSCTTCVKEMPQMVETYNKFKGRGHAVRPAELRPQLRRNPQAALQGGAGRQWRRRQVLRQRRPHPHHFRDR